MQRKKQGQQLPPDAATRALLVEHLSGTCKPTPEIVLAVANSAVSAALGSAGPSWRAERDATVRIAKGKPLVLDLVGYRHIDVSVDSTAIEAQCRKLSGEGHDVKPLALLKQIVAAMVGLWAGHFDICPYDAYRHEMLCRAAAEGGFGTIHVPPHEWSRAVAVASFFQKSTVAQQLVARHGVDFARGLVLEHRMNKRATGLLDDLFYRVQAIVAPETFTDLLKRYAITAQGTTESLVRDVLPLVSGHRLRPAGLGFGQRTVAGRAPTERDWPGLVQRLGELLIPHLERPDDRPNTPFTPPACPRGPQSGLQASGPSGWACEPPPGVPSAEPDPRRGLACTAQGSGHDSALGSRPGLERGRTVHFDQLDRHYTQRAAALPLEHDVRHGVHERTPELLRVGYLNSEPAALSAIGSGLIDWSATRVGCIDGKAELQLHRRADPLEIPDDGGAMGDGQPPHLCLMCDSSGSMKFNPTAREQAQRGKYDVVLAACYGMFAHIQATGLADQVQVACINFSGRSIESGWQRFSNLRKTKEVLFTYQGGGTTLDPQAVRRVLASRPATFLSVLITDGCLSNVPDVIAELKRLVAARCDVVLLHVGARNAFTQAVEKIGTVHLVQTADDLVGLSLRVARERYGRGTGCVGRSRRAGTVR